MQLSYAERDSNSNQRKNCKQKTNKQTTIINDYMMVLQSFTTYYYFIKIFGILTETVSTHI